MTLTEGLDNLRRTPFLVEPDTGAVKLNFDPQQGMKGYFDFMVIKCFIWKDEIQTKSFLGNG
jgi:hypothetical protein